MFLVDKYHNDTNNITCHQDIIEKLISTFDRHSQICNNIRKKKTKVNINNLINNLENGTWKYSNFQHLIVYGPKGCGKEHVVKSILERIYGKKAVELKDVCYTISGYGNTKTKVIIKQSKYHIVIQPNSNGFDRYLIQEIIQDYAKTQLLNILKYQRKFKIVIIDKIDSLSYYAQASLRRTMEKYSNTCKFIFICNQLSKVNEPIRSRCLLVRVPLPRNYKIFEAILRICMKEKIKISSNEILSIISNCDGRVKSAIWSLELKKKDVKEKVSWRVLLNNIVKDIIDENNYKIDKIGGIMKNIELNLYLLFITNMSTQRIISELMKEFLKITKLIELKFQIIEITSIFEKRIATGTRHILHLRAYVIRIIYLLTKFYYGKNYNYRLNELEV
jgi:replication factor C subunit 3/5